MINLIQLLQNLNRGGSTSDAVLAAAHPSVVDASVPPASGTHLPVDNPAWKPAPVFGGPGVGTEQAVTPPDASPSPAVKAATTMAPPIPESMKSPPDLMQMYERLMEKSRNAAAMDRGLTLIAAGLTPYQSTREALISKVGSGGGGGSAGAPSMDDLINLQKMQMGIAEQERQRAALPGLMKQYGLDEATVNYLDSTGQLDEVIGKLASPDTEVVKGADGSQILINKRTGETIHNLTPAAPRETEYVELGGEGGKVLVYKDTKEPVAGGKPITSVEPKLETDKLTRADGSVALTNKNTGDIIKELSPPKEGDIKIETLADGTKQATQDGKPLGDPFGPKTDVTTDDIKEWKQINADGVKAGEPYISLKDWILKRTKAGVPGNKDASGVDYGNPPAGQAWIHDKQGNVVTDEQGIPKTGWIKTSPEYAEFVRKEKEQAGKDTKAAQDAADAAQANLSTEVKQSIVNQDIDEAVQIIDDNADSLVGVTGWGSLLTALPGSEAGRLSDRLGTIRTSIGLATLNDMRKASGSGASGLGSVTEEEHAMLQKAYGTLRQSGDDRDLRRNLLRLKLGRNLVIHGIKDPQTGQLRAPTADEIDAEMLKAGEPGIGGGGGGKLKIPDNFKIKRSGSGQ